MRKRKETECFDNFGDAYVRFCERGIRIWKEDDKYYILVCANGHIEIDIQDGQAIPIWVADGE